MTSSDWLSDLVGPPRIKDGETLLPRRRYLRLEGDGFTATDDDANDATILELIGGGDGVQATGLLSIVSLRAIAGADREDKQRRTVNEDASDLSAPQPASFVFVADKGAGVADDGINVIKPNDVSLGSDGRWYRDPQVVTSTRHGVMSPTDYRRALGLDDWSNISVSTSQHVNIAVGDGIRRRLVDGFGSAITGGSTDGNALYVHLLATGATDGDTILVDRKGTDRNTVYYFDEASGSFIGTAPSPCVTLFRFRSGSWRIETHTPPHRSAVFDVRDFGAVGNGLNDDTAAIQAAVDAVSQNRPVGVPAYGVVYLPAGRYKTTAPIALPRNDAFRLFGDGKENTLIDFEQNPATVTGTFSFTTGTITRSSGSFVTDGFKVGMRLEIGGSSSNDFSDREPRMPTVTSVSALTLTVATDDPMVVEGPTASVTIVGRGAALICDQEETNSGIGNWTFDNFTVYAAPGSRCIDYNQPPGLTFDQGRCTLKMTNCAFLSSASSVVGLVKFYVINRSVLIGCDFNLGGSNTGSPANGVAMWLSGSGMTIHGCRTIAAGGGLIYMDLAGGETTMLNCRCEGSWGTPAYHFDGSAKVTLINCANEIKGEVPALVYCKDARDIRIVQMGLGPPVLSGTYYDGIKLENCKHVVVEQPFKTVDFQGASATAYMVNADADCDDVRVVGAYNLDISVGNDCNLLGTNCIYEGLDLGAGANGGRRCNGVQCADVIYARDGHYNATYSNDGQDLTMGPGDGHTPGTDSAGDYIVNLRTTVSGASGKAKILDSDGTQWETYRSSGTIFAGAPSSNVSFVGNQFAFYGGTPVSQPSRVGQLTDSTGGSADNTVAAVSGSGADTTINNNFADLVAKVNALELLIHNVRLSA